MYRRLPTTLGEALKIRRMTSITGTIITYNEERHIEACIASLSAVCDEIVVVDSLSTDRTVELAESAGANVFSQEYRGEGPQRNLAERQASNDWIMALDADERLDDEMRDTIRAIKLTDPAKAYSFNRKSFVGTRWIKGPGFYPDVVTRLYNRTQAAYEPSPGHANVVAPRVEEAKGHILHYTYDGLSHWIAKLNWLTSRDAQGMFDAGQPPSRLKPVLSFFASGFRQLFLRGGLLKGLDGWTITVTSMFRSYMKYLKLNELHDQAKNSKQAGTSENKEGLNVGHYRDPTSSR